jgi:putative membrane-bound dehydrogenase-like protein
MPLARAIAIAFCSLLVAEDLSQISLAAELSLPVASDQDPQDVPPSPAESLAKFRVPDGFHVSLFAAEPHVRQPIAMAFDDRGRLWVAECFSYPNWKREKTDRIVIFADTDQDGHFDEHKVFLDGITHLSSIEIGFGGVWITAAPELLFVPDRDRDDVPDGPPVAVLDGFATKKVNHNVVNGLQWGPDGWLWGRHGIQEESIVGAPGTPELDRTKLNCCNWRFHPRDHRFEVITNGTTNSWGLDFNQYGEAFFTNCVIGHLWHVVPGARYQRMYGQDYNPFSYELMAACSDHLHWEADKWQNARDGEQQSRFGGGHAHCGAMIYLGDNWPAEYRGRMFTCNVHGQRINQDALDRQGSGYIGRHGDDLFFANSPWFRGVELDFGPDGGVYVLDWTDFGECHDSDGVHRDSGRIYKIVYGRPTQLNSFDLDQLSDAALVDLHLHHNEWYVRHARRILHERALNHSDLTALQTKLRNAFEQTNSVPQKLRYLWTLHVVGGATQSWCLEQLDHPDEYVRVWAVRLLVGDLPNPEQAMPKLVQLAETDPSPRVLLALASALQRFDEGERFPLASALVGHVADATDQNMALMLWYGIEPLVAADPGSATALAGQTKIPLLRKFIARRLVER